MQTSRSKILSLNVNWNGGSREVHFCSTAYKKVLYLFQTADAFDCPSIVTKKVDHDIVGNNSTGGYKIPFKAYLITHCNIKIKA